VVSVWDPTDAGPQPRAANKCASPNTIWYTPTSGILADGVWLEPVERAYISGVKVTPKLDESAVVVEMFAEAPGLGMDFPVATDVEVDVLDGKTRIASGSMSATLVGKQQWVRPMIKLAVKSPKPWSSRIASPLWPRDQVEEQQEDG